MSWFDTAGLASFAKSALSTAQKHIDKALDIREEDLPHNRTAVVSTIPIDADNFFEAFGLGPASIPPLSPPPAETKVSKKQKVSHEQSKPSSGSHAVNPGFWTDTWSSFFEGNASVPEVQSTPKTTQPEPSPKSIPVKDGAVSSQPQRASLFPSSNVEASKEDETSLQSEPLIITQAELSPGMLEHIKDVNDQEETCIETERAETQSDVVDMEVPLQDSDDQRNVQSLCSRTEKPDAVQDLVSPPVETPEYKEQNITEVLIEKPDELEVSSKGSSIDIQCPVSDEIDKLESELSSPMEYDIVDANEKCLESSVMKSAILSPSQQQQRIAITIEKSYFNISTDMLNAPTISESFINVDSNVSSPPQAISLASSSEGEEIGIPISDRSSEQPLSEAESSTSDSFQILGKSVIQADWTVKDLESKVRDTEEDVAEFDQSGIADSGSSSGKDEYDISMKEYELKSCSSNESQEMANSFVKCSMDDVEGQINRGHSPLSTTTSERSDVTKLESEQNTSGDENETTTSSDIEILSPPNGENNDRNVSPLKHMWVPRTLRSHRSESPSSDGSKDSSMPILPESEEVTPCGSAEESGSYYFKMGKDSEFSQTLKGIDIAKVFQQQDELQSLLEAREKQIIDLSKENIRLHENEEILQSQVSEMKASASRELQNISSMTKEFTHRIAQVESQMQTAIKEKDTFKKKLDEAQSQVIQRVIVSEMEEAIKEKDQQIKELMDEGEKLSKKELQHTTIIKKLRAKEEEMEHSVKSLREKLEESSKEAERLRKSLGAKDDQEKKHIDAIRQLTASVSQQEVELEAYKSALEDSKEKELSFKKSLESTYRDFTELQKLNVAKDKEIQALQSSLEMSAREKLQEGLDQAHKEATKEKEILLIQLDDMRNSMKRLEDDSNHRESMLKDDISRLQMRLQESEARSEDLTKNMSLATRPLVRQIENLQTSYNTQINSWEKVEKNLTERLSDTQNQLIVCSERERLANEKYQELNTKFKKLETQSNALRQEKLQLSSHLEVLNSKNMVLEESKNRSSSSVDVLKHNFNQELNKLKEEKNDTERELKHGLELLKEERCRVQELQEELRQKENKFPLVENISPGHSPSASVRSSLDGVNSWIQDQNHDRRIIMPPSYRVSVYDSLRTSSTSILENLQSQLKQREGEIAQLQCEITRLERERETMSQELVDLTTQKDELQEKADKLQLLEKLHKELEQKYNTLLQMYGEKLEAYEELQLDLIDVKTMYKAQIEELVRKTN